MCVRGMVKLKHMKCNSKISNFVENSKSIELVSNKWDVVQERNGRSRPAVKSCFHFEAS